MPRYVVLLRGVNVGKGNRVPMAGFQALLEGLGFSSVKTLLNSGNAVFDAPGRAAAAHADAIAEAVRSGFGVTTAVIVKTTQQWAAVVEHSPIAVPDTDHSRVLVALGQDADALQALLPLVPQARAVERFVVTAHAAYLHCPDGLNGSAVADALVGRARRHVTTRNWATVLKLQALLEAAQARDDAPHSH